ncbi:MAG: hypothetical protein MJ237_08210 [bacterium]|nr:hypothetical protein [bacterium]
MAWNINSLKKDLAKADFIEIFRHGIFSEEEKTQINTIFEVLAGDDGVLSQEEWSEFQKNVNTDKDKSKITEDELSRYSPTDFMKTGQFDSCSLRTSMSRFYCMVEHYIRSIKDDTKTDEDNVSQNQSVTDVNEYAYGEDIYADLTLLNVESKYNNENAFTGNWLLEDKYGSKSYNDWMKNNGYEFDQGLANAMIKDIKRRFNMSGYVKDGKTYCASAVNDTTLEVKACEQRVSRDKAYKCASAYADNPKFKELPHNIVAEMNLADLPAGCIIVYNAEYKKNGENKSGHIGITGGGEDSNADGVNDIGYDMSYKRLKMVTQRKFDHIRVFVPIKQSEAEDISDIEDM